MSNSDWRMDGHAAAGLMDVVTAWQPDELVLALTGAGISAESGVPTFRGSDGFWTVGSENYRPEELATQSMFRAKPDAVWAFYLERMRALRGVRPNAGHQALVELEQGLGEGFRLVTQNVDGLHVMAGSDPDRSWCIHGRIHVMRCADDCGRPPHRAPAELLEAPVETGVDERSRELLHCQGCGAWLRPHVLWFDEFYDEQNFHFDSAMGAAAVAGLLLVVGTSGATTLPSQLVSLALQRRTPLIVVDPEDGSFQAAADQAEHGVFIRGPAGAALPLIAEAILARRSACP